jgi:hypothetical protein
MVHTNTKTTELKLPEYAMMYYQVNRPLISIIILIKQPCFFPGGHLMIKKNELCQKIQEIYPEVGQCGIDLKVNVDKRQKAWVVSLKKDNHELKHFLEKPDAEACMQGKQCVSLGLEIAQMLKNIKGEQF